MWKKDYQRRRPTNCNALPFFSGCKSIFSFSVNALFYVKVVYTSTSEKPLLDDTTGIQHPQLNNNDFKTLHSIFAQLYFSKHNLWKRYNHRNKTSTDNTKIILPFADQLLIKISHREILNIYEHLDQIVLLQQ